MSQATKVVLATLGIAALVSVLLVVQYTAGAL